MCICIYGNRNRWAENIINSRATCKLMFKYLHSSISSSCLGHGQHLNLIIFFYYSPCLEYLAFLSASLIIIVSLFMITFNCFFTHGFIWSNSLLLGLPLPLEWHLGSHPISSNSVVLPCSPSVIKMAD